MAIPPNLQNMNPELAKKTCKMCCVEIPSESRKCPYCQHFQNRLSLVIYHPASMVLVLCIPLVGMMILWDTIFDTGENYQTYQKQIVITDSRIAFGDIKSGPTVAIMGTIRNTSPVSWKDIQFHADFFDAQGRHTDVGEKEDYSFFLPAKGTSSFKVSFRMEFPETNYIKCNVRVATAKDASVRW
jgi:hypothetical protein